MAKQSLLGELTQQPMAFARLPVLLRVLSAHGGVELPYLPRLAFVLAMSVATAPLRLYEQVRFARAIENQPVRAPIFILGHWRSGTTFLHELMCKDPNLAYPSYLQVCATDCFLGSEPLVRFVLERLIPETRPMDNVQLSFLAPAEEEFALANLDTLSYYHAWYFPRQILKLFQPLVLLETLTPGERRRWQTSYLRFLQKVTLQAKGRRLVLKNPPNTARIQALLELFPNARFVHIYRNPYAVYQSTMNLLRKLLPVIAFQKISEAQMEQAVLDGYEMMMRQYLIQRPLIPARNLLEIRYEDLKARPLEILQLIYRELDIEGFERAKPRFEEYVLGQSDYRNNQYSALDEATLERIYRRWQFTIDAWQYEPPRRQRR